MAVTFRPETPFNPSDICGICRDSFVEDQAPLAHDSGENHLMHRHCCILALHHDPRCPYCRVNAVPIQPETDEERALLAHATQAVAADTFDHPDIINELAPISVLSLGIIFLPQIDSFLKECEVVCREDVDMCYNILIISMLVSAVAYACFKVSESRSG